MAMFSSVRVIVPALAALAASALCASAPASAATQAPASAPAIIDRIAPATLLEALGSIGAQAEGLDDTDSAYRVVFASGARAVFQRVACDQDECTGLLMLGLFTLPEGRPAAETEDTRRSFSATYNAVSVITNERGEHLVKSYVILDGGITPANLAAQIGVFGEALAAYAVALYGED